MTTKPHTGADSAVAVSVSHLHDLIQAAETVAAKIEKTDPENAKRLLEAAGRFEGV